MDFEQLLGIFSKVFLARYLVSHDLHRISHDIDHNLLENTEGGNSARKDVFEVSERRPEVFQCAMMVLLRMRDFEAAEYCLQIEPDAIKRCRNKPGPLSELLNFHGDHPDLVEWLIAHGAERDACLPYDNKPLHLASRYRYVGSLCVLLDHGADIEMGTGVDGNPSPLMTAARNGQLATVMALVARGADIHRKLDHYESGVLELARESGNAEVVEFLSYVSQFNKQ